MQYHEHDSLLEKRPDEDLTEEERKAAWEEYEKEKAGLVAYPVFHGNVGTIAHMPVASVGPTMNYQVPYRGYFQNISYPRPAVTVLPPPGRAFLISLLTIIHYEIFKKCSGNMVSV